MNLRKLNRIRGAFVRFRVLKMHIHGSGGAANTSDFKWVKGEDEYADYLRRKRAEKARLVAVLRFTHPALVAAE